MEAYNGPMIDTIVESEEINHSLHDIVSNDIVKKHNDVTENAKNGKQTQKKVSFKEPLTDIAEEALPADVNDIIIDDVFAQNDDQTVTFSNNVAPKSDVIKIPEISDLWWSEVDNGRLGEPQTDLG